MVRVIKIIDEDYPTSVYDVNRKAIKVQVQNFATSYLIIEFNKDKQILCISPTDREDSFISLSDYDENKLIKDLQEFINQLLFE